MEMGYRNFKLSSCPVVFGSKIVSIISSGRSAILLLALLEVNQVPVDTLLERWYNLHAW